MGRPLPSKHPSQGVSVRPGRGRRRRGGRRRQRPPLRRGSVPASPASPPGARSRSWVSPVHRWLGFGQAAPGREARGGKESRGPLRGAGEGRASTHTRAPASTGHSDAPARDTPPPKKKDQKAHSPGALRGAGARGRSHSHRPPSGSLTARSPGSSRLPRGGGGGSAAATSPPSGCRADALTAAGAPLAQAPCGQHEAAVAACGLFPPFINPAQGTDGGRG